MTDQDLIAEMLRIEHEFEIALKAKYFDKLMGLMR